MLAHRLSLGRSGMPYRLAEAIEHNQALAVSVVLGVFASACALLLALPGVTFLTHAPHDTLIFVDAAYRLAQGEIPNVNFHTPLGALTSVLPYLGLVVGGSFGAAMPTALAIALVALTPIILYVLATRFRWYLALPVGALLILLIAAPLVTGDVPSHITMAMWYNRFCWAVLTLLFLMWMTPQSQTSGSWSLEGVIAGVLVLVLFYTKITYGLVAIAYLGFWFTLRKDNRRTVAVAAGVCIAVAVAVELIWHLHGPYIADIAFALHAGPAVRGGLLQPLKTALKFSHEVVLIGLVVCQLVALRCLKARDLFFFTFVLGAGLVIINQNSEDNSVACLIAVLAVAAEQVARIERPDGVLRPWIARLAAFGLLLAFVAEPLVYRSTALVRHYGEAHARHEDPTLPAALTGFYAKEYKGYAVVPGSPEVLEAVTGSHLTPSAAFSLLRDRTMIGTPNLLGTAEYLFTLNEGVKALSAFHPRGKRIFAFDIVNPFPFVLGAPPASGDLFCYHLDRQYSKTNYLPVKDVLGDISIAMVPKFPMEYKDRDALLDLYGEYLRTHFKVVTDTPYWTVWERLESAADNDHDSSASPGTNAIGATPIPGAAPGHAVTTGTGAT